MANIYKVRDLGLLYELHLIWGIDVTFEGDYYKLLQNHFPERTAWTDRYSTTLFSPFHDISFPRKVIQPIPDLLRWLSVHELHYLPWQEASLLQPGPWDENTGLFLPSKILDLCFSVIPTPDPNITRLIAILAWIKPNEATKYYEKLQAQVRATLEADQKREMWKVSPLYRTKTREELEKICRNLKIPVTTALEKHDVVELISRKRGDRDPTVPD